MDALGQAIRNARKTNGWTQQELADYVSEEIGRETGLNQTVLSRWEQRDTTIPDEAPPGTRQVRDRHEPDRSTPAQLRTGPRQRPPRTVGRSRVRSEDASR